MISRRDFLCRASALTTAVALTGRCAISSAEPFGLPLGLQLYSVRQQLATDYEATLQQVSSVGYREVEAAGFFKRSALEVKQAMQKADLRCVSAHYPFAEFTAHFDAILTFAKEVGIQYLICASPGFKKPDAAAVKGPVLSLDDWHWNADQFNEMGTKVAGAGLYFGYHNHVREFAVTEGVIPYMELLRLTDPAKVTFELDCGWAVVAGAAPESLLRDHPGRFSMLHVKDFKRDRIANGGPGEHEPIVTELGMGSIDYRPIFAQAAKTQKIKHLFVEQEAFDMPYIQSLKVDADYMRGLKT
jgi:sugar phosphate isomerase/epimerase